MKKGFLGVPEEASSVSVELINEKIAHEADEALPLKSDS